MKKTIQFLSVAAAILFIVVSILPRQASAQSPQAFKYQAVVRDNEGEILQNGDVGIRMSIHDSVADGTIVYQETFFQITSQFGLVNIEIGKGTPSIGIFEDISWGSNPKFMETEIDPDGGSSFVSMGTSELLSVPYALYAETSGGTSAWGKNGDTIYYNNGNVGIGTSSPGAKLDVAGHIWQTATGKSVFIGEDAGANDDLTNNSNVFIGHTSGMNNLTGYQNVFIGRTSGMNNLTGSHNVFIGRLSGYDNTEGGSNTFLGNSCGQGNTTGGFNTFVGDRCGLLNTTGESNTFLGHKSGMYNLTGSHNVFLGTRAGYYETGSNKLYISNWGTSNPLIYGEFDNNILVLNAQVGIGTDNPTTELDINGQIKITDGNQGVDKVLTSDANGVATWAEQTERIDLGPNYGTVVSPATGKTWLDRNLGASQVATASDDVAAYGDLYQWGRAQDGHEDRSSATHGYQAFSWIADEGSNVWDKKFIISFDWLHTPNHELWKGMSAENNPCPSGFRIPTNAEWNQERQTWATQDMDGAFGSVLKLPTAGIRHYNNGNIGNNVGNYWSSTVSDSDARHLRFDGTTANLDTSFRSNGFSVRCIKN